MLILGGKEGEDKDGDMNRIWGTIAGLATAFITSLGFTLVKKLSNQIYHSVPAFYSMLSASFLYNIFNL